MLRRASLVLWLALAALAPDLLSGEPGAPVPAVDFAREVQPLLAARCFKCHGGVKQQAGLSLLFRSEALAPTRAGKPAIVPGKPEESELVRRITAADESERMPPEGGALKPNEVEVLRRWIAAGAPYAEHWAYLPLKPHPLPEVSRKDWPRGAADRWALAKMEAAALSPAPEADRAVLLRRASLDLLGLPPDLDEVDRFQADAAPDAYERLVDRLLASPAFGERWARLWLDMARYADTQGYEKDNRRTIWRYRDWVIDAYNRDLPFDRFTIEQLAGDLLPEPTLEQRLATAFHRNTMTNTEGGTDNEEFRVAAVMDRISTTWQVWMGTTFGCVQCHRHPYDPFKHEDYYRFFAFFNQTADQDNDDEAPTLETPTREDDESARTLRAEIERLRGELAAPRADLDAAMARWEASLRAAGGWEILRPESKSAESGAELALREDGAVRAGGTRPANDVYTITAAPGAKRVAAIRLEALLDDALPRRGPGRADDGNFVLSRLAVEAVADGSPPRPLELASASADFSQDGFPVAHAFKPPDPKKNGWAVQPQAGRAHTAHFFPREPIELRDGERLRLRFEHRYERPGFVLGCFRLAAAYDAAAAERAAMPPDLVAILDLPREKRGAEEQAELVRRHRAVAPELAPLREQIAALEKRLASIPRPTTPVLVELAPEQRRATHVFIRGSFLAPGDPVAEGTPASLPPFRADEPRNRLGLARWIVSEENPLTPRVIVNRFWEQLFGLGLVETSEDFGTQGAPPTHPELLDLLARRFVREQGWSVKALLKDLVLSSVYRQSSAATPALIERDPKNLLLARGPRFRLEAELVRDQALAACGLLSRKMLGPSVMPLQPDGVWNVVYSGDSWQTSAGEDRHRRGVYTFWRRTSPYPSMMAFDANSREYCVVRRLRTNTPLQALVTLNDPVYIEAAQALARRLVREAGPDESARARLAFRLSLLREPAPEEIERLVALHREERRGFAGDPEAAKKLASDPLGPPPDVADVAELAAWTLVANVIMNLDEFLTRG
jgi:hypothetical protein